VEWKAELAWLAATLHTQSGCMSTIDQGKSVSQRLTS